MLIHQFDPPRAAHSLTYLPTSLLTYLLTCLLPWVQAQRARLQQQLADVTGTALSMPLASPPSSPHDKAAKGGGGRRRSMGENTLRLAAQAEELGEFVEEEMPPKKADLLEVCAMTFP